MASNIAALLTRSFTRTLTTSLTTSSTTRSALQKFNKRMPMPMPMPFAFPTKPASPFSTNSTPTETTEKTTPSKRNNETAKDQPPHPEDWAEHDFVRVAEASLECVCESVSAVGYGTQTSVTDFDIDLSQGVLTIHVNPLGVYVANTQTPNRQIWLSSPSSGPWRYGWDAQAGEWVSTRDAHTLASRLSTELTDAFNTPVSITFGGVRADTV